MTEQALFQWFWQPPINGAPGLIMVVDIHPGPDSPEVPFLLERVGDALIYMESRIPSDHHLFQHKIFMRDPFETWAQVQVEAMPRTWRIVKPELKQSALQELWYSRAREEMKWKH